MKSLNSFKNYGLALIAMTLMLTAANAQSRYKHVPRVKVDGKKVEKVTTQEVAAPTTTAAVMNVEANNTVATEPTVNVENTAVASVAEDVVVLNHKSNSVINHKKVVKNNKKADRDGFTKTTKESSKLLDVKDVKKSNMAKWVLYMIICLIAALIFTILAIVFLYSLSYSLIFLYYIFLAIATLAWIGAIVFLILGLAGVM